MMTIFDAVLYIYVLLRMGSPARCETRILEPVKLSARPPPPPSGGKMVELLQAGYKAVDLAKFRTSYNPDRENVYYFVNRSDPDTAYPVLLGDEQQLSLAGFDPSRRTVVIVHGWMGSVHARVCVAVAKAYLQAEDVNVILVDWSAGADTGYVSAVANTVTSGESAARFMNWLAETGSTPESWHLIGHSLGAHQAGVIGRRVRGNVGYMTGLDPAMPLWVTNHHRLRASDSGYTEVIHTNAGMAGYPLPMGHVDIYPNGGLGQPGCDGQGCDHDRCVYLMAESLNTSFEAVQCPSYLSAMVGSCSLPARILMGGSRPKTGSSGVFYVQTGAVSPFSLYNERKHEI